MRLKFFLFFSLICTALTTTVPAAADAPLDAMAAYSHVQGIRDEVDKLSGKNASQADLSKALGLLQGALIYLQRKDVRELAAGNIYLYSRRPDVQRDLAIVCARMDDRENALSSLEAMAALSWYPSVAKTIEKDEAFTSIRSDPRFRRVVSLEVLPERLLGSSILASPYKEQLTVEERLAGLSLFWSEARLAFVYFDHVPDLDWNKVYKEYLSKVVAANSTREYYHIMMQLAPLLQDGHTNIYPPKELLDARPPIGTELFGDVVLIKSVYSRSLAKTLHVGDEILAIDGVSVKRYAEQNVAPFVSSSTPQDKLVRMYDYELLSGDASKSVALKLRDATGAVRDQVVARAGYRDVSYESPLPFRMLPSQIAYINLDNFESEDVVKAFEAALPRIQKARGLVIDVRDNGGGSTIYGQMILSYLTRSSIGNPVSYYRSESAAIRAQGGVSVNLVPTADDGGPYLVQHSKVFEGPVAVLTGAHTFSAAEDFVAAFAAIHRGITVGERTAGSTGQPLFFDLPGGGSARICVKRDLSPDGTEFVGKGIQPTFEVHRGVADVRSGKDPVLDTATKQLATRT
jgi:carboxyl-terminal processing protease